jgi:hypothetical protein
MFYTGLNPTNMQKVYVPRTPEEKAQQRALLQYYKPENRQFVMTALKKAGREDLIGNGAECLVRPAFMQNVKGEYVARGRHTPSERGMKKQQKPKRYANLTAKPSKNKKTAANHVSAVKNSHKSKKK